LRINLPKSKTNAFNTEAGIENHKSNKHSQKNQINPNAVSLNQAIISFLLHYFSCLLNIKEIQQKKCYQKCYQNIHLMSSNSKSLKKHDTKQKHLLTSQKNI